PRPRGPRHDGPVRGRRRRTRPDGRVARALAPGGRAVIAAARSRPRSRLAGPPVRVSVVAAAALSLWSGYIHFVYMQSHWQEGWAYGAFFLAAGVGQALYAPLLLRFRGTWLLLAGIAGNVAIVGMYLVSRTAGP